MSQTIGVGIIARNAESTIRTCIQSFAPHVDQIVVVLAGKSEDKTARLAKKASTKVELYDFSWIDDFSAARNFCFSKLRTDWLMWVDADDEVYQAENLRRLCETSHPEIGGIWFPYHYALDEFGNVTTIYERERLLRASCGWVWRGRLHETVSPLRECQYVRTNDVIIKHNHLAGQPRGERNFKLLNIMLKEAPDDKRVWLYLGHQHFAAQHFKECAEWYLKFGSDQGAIPIERYQALCYCSKALRALGDKQCLEVALMAVALQPDYTDGYLEVAHSHFMLGDMDKAIHWAKLSENKELIKEPPHVIFVNPLEYTFNKHVMLSEAYLKKGDIGEAKRYMVMARKVRPLREVEQQLKLIDELELRQRVADSIKVIAVNLLNNKEILKLESLIKATPYWFRDLPDYKELQGGCSHYLSEAKDDPAVLEQDKDKVLVNIANCKDPKALLDDLDKKYKSVTVVCPIPSEDTRQIVAYSQRDMEELVNVNSQRRVINLQRESSRIICQYELKEAEGIKVRIFVGQGLEYWSPKTITDVGCGGSETAAAMVAKEMAREGCYPIVYAMDTQVWDGVVYRHFSDYRPDSTPCHLFISSRVPDVFYDQIPSKQKWLWAHDIHFFHRFTPEVAAQIDVLMALSQWHVGHLKRVYPFLKDAEVIDMDNLEKTYEDDWTAGQYYADAKAHKLPKIVIIGDAIDTTRFENLKEERKLHRFIWCSSPDRGLGQVLDMWPLIRKELPDAELKIFYGWEYFDTSLWVPEQRELKKKLLKQITQDGVEWCGRVGQNQVARELARSQCMLYPPPHNFRETYGIAFLEAQAAGVLCFYRQNGALGETIGNRGIPLAIDMTPEQIVRKIVDTLKNPKLCGKIISSGRKYAMNRTWEKQTKKMLKLYKDIEGNGLY